MDKVSELPLPEDFLDFVEANGLDPSIYAAGDCIPRYVRLKLGREAHVEEIEAEIKCKLEKVGWLPGFYPLPTDIQIANTKAYKEGKKEETYKEGKDDVSCSRASEDGPDGGENSPIEQVALTVPTTDDPSLPTFTFRTWTLGILACVLLSFVNQFFLYRREPLTVAATCAQIVMVPIGHLMASMITNRVFFKGQKWEFSLNPGPFNVKEHVLATIFANAGAGSVYAIHVVSTVKVFYKKELTFVVALLVVLTSQVLGFGWAGVFRRYLVQPAAMWWPQNLVQVSLFRPDCCCCSCSALPWELSISAFEEKTMDVHTKSMRKYKQVPEWWFMCILLLNILATIFICEYYNDQLQLPWWGVLLACGLAIFFTLPMGIIKATTNQVVPLLTHSPVNVARTFVSKMVINNIA
ncbi:hypothetical protein HS088_TW01G00967 [Tripterygium wilfordii]|uniref:Oligopeptide transporter n=1 Tax=Tripterygium wilfordii TaxID=458696 RepID=A0A7J7E3E4_TRIWF|nr:hypothetical protein HS088_TW01G00967 [Tripterygium wilfordii]